jgi:phosphopantetheinyl transferase
MSHRIGKQIIMHEHNKSRSHSTRTLLLQLIQNMQKCPYIETSTQGRSEFSCIYQVDINLTTITLNWT